MATLTELRARADELQRHDQPHLRMTPLRKYRVLAREFPDAERDQLVVAAQLTGTPTRVYPTWAQWGQPQRGAQIRYQLKRKGAPPEPVTVRTISEEELAERAVLDEIVAGFEATREENDMQTALIISVPAKDLVEGDWIEGHGEIVSLMTNKKFAFVTFYSLESNLYPLDEIVEVRLEDHGEEE